MKSLFSISPISRFGAILTHFMRNKRGNVGMIYALAAIPILAGIGSAVDYNNVARVKTQMQAASDAGVLAAVSAVDPTKPTLGEDAIRTLVTTNIMSNLGTSPAAANPNITVTQSNGLITANVSAPVRTIFMKMFGIPTITAHAMSAAMPGGTNQVNVEVALVLDTTLSMSDNGKIDALKSAATSLTNTILAANGTSGNGNGNGNTPKVRISVVPYTDYVNVGTIYKNANWLTNTADYTTTYAGYCTDTYPNATYGPPIVHNDPCTADGRPTTCTWTEYPVISNGAPVQVCYPGGTTTHTWLGCVGSRDTPLELSEEVLPSSPTPALYDFSNCPTPLTRLTADSPTLLSAINALTPTGETYIAPGLVWGWRTLSPKQPFQDGLAYNKNHQKYIVLMTDGFNTHSFSGNGNGGYHENTNTADADNTTLQTCTAIKAAGIQIFTVSFQVYNNTSAPLLQACATDSTYYFNAISNAALQSTFATIAANIKSSFGNARLVK